MSDIVINDVTYKGIDTVTFNKATGGTAKFTEGERPSGTINITSNGIHNVTNYENANVNIEGKEDLDAELNAQEELLAELESSVDELQEKPVNPLQLKCDNAKSLAYEFWTNNGVSFNDDIVTQVMCGVDTSKVAIMNNIFAQYLSPYNSYIDLSNVVLDISNCIDLVGAFRNGKYIKKLPKIIYSNKLEYLSNIDELYVDCAEITEVPYIDTHNASSASKTHSGCLKLTSVPAYDLSSAQTVSYFLRNCSQITSTPEFNTIRAYNMSYFAQGCSSLETVNGLDMRAVTQNSNASSMFNGCTNLTNLTLKNIRVNLIIGSGTSYGHLLTLDSLINTIKELWNNTGNALGGTRTLTIGTANLEKLANVYVKLIDITDEMRTEDEYIDNKAPFVQCESTDEGAMLITEYVTNVKNWQLA